MTDTTTIKPKRSHARFLKAAVEQDWEVTSEVVRGITVVTATDPAFTTEDIEPHSRRRKAVVGSFYSTSGAYESGHVVSMHRYSADEEPVERKARFPFTRILTALDNGPKKAAERQALAEAMEAKEAERKAQAQVILNAAAGVEEVQRLKDHIARELADSERNLVQALENIQGRIAEAVEAIKSGRRTNDFGGGLFGGDHTIWQAHHHAARRNAALDTAHRLTNLFGDLPKDTY